ncbi:MAG: YqgE/AlgH family protein [Alphaproteobacteria bacterium]
MSEEPKKKKVFITPKQAKIYLVLALLIIAFPTIMTKILPSHSGKFLVSSGVMDFSSFFGRSVIYLDDHSGYSAFGFIINRPLSEQESAPLRARFPHIGRFHYGGPVAEGEELFLMVPDDESFERFRIHRLRDLEADDLETYNAIIADSEIAKTVILFSGYAGWTVLQLNRELLRGAWNVIPFRSDLMLMQEGEQIDIWNRAMEDVLQRARDSVDAI